MVFGTGRSDSKRTPSSFQTEFFPTEMVFEARRKYEILAVERVQFYAHPGKGFHSTTLAASHQKERIVGGSLSTDGCSRMKQIGLLRRIYYAQPRIEFFCGYIVLLACGSRSVNLIKSSIVLVAV